VENATWCTSGSSQAEEPFSAVAFCTLHWLIRSSSQAKQWAKGPFIVIDAKPKNQFLGSKKAWTMIGYLNLGLQLSAIYLCRSALRYKGVLAKFGEWVQGVTRHEM
jgi:hypothetical protein